MILSIQFLRFIAASCVVLSHSFLAVGLDQVGGFGVDVFFVISGFIIFYITQEDSSGFMIKRLIRIVPMYWLFTFGLLLVAFLMPSLLEGKPIDLGHFFISLVFLPHWGPFNIFQPFLKLGWTLNYEMAFYVLFYIAMMISHRYRGVITALMIVTIVTVLKMIDLGDDSVLLFYAYDVWIEFILGMGLARLWLHRKYSLKPTHAVGLILLGFIWMFYSQANAIYALDLGAFKIDARFIIWGVPSLCIVFAALGIEQVFKAASAQTKRAILWLGEWSYPVYLVHFYIVALLDRVLFVGIPWWLLFVISLVISNVIAAIVSYVFDRPLRKALLGRFLRPKAEPS